MRVKVRRFVSPAYLILVALLACHERAAPSVSAPALAPPQTREDAVDAPAAIAPETAPPAASPPPPPACPATPWAMYAHDPARTSASDGCVDGPLAITWRLTRKGPCGYESRAGRIVHAIAEENAIFTAVSCGGAPAVMRVTTSGEPLWTMSRADHSRGHWPALAGSTILFADDGVFLIDRETGKWRGRELDIWGEPLVAGDEYFVDNTFQLDGSGPFVGAFDATFKWKWTSSGVYAGKGKAIPKTGGIAYADGIIVHAAAMGVRTVPSLAAHDATSGERRWLASGTWPESAPSIGGDRVFAIERWSGENADRLVARSLADGGVVWSETVAWTRGPAPVISEKLVVIHGADGIRAHDRATGKVVWSNAAPRKAAFDVTATTMAVAKGSSTLVVTSGPRVLVLSLDDGAERWSEAIVSGTSQTALGGITVESPIVVGRTVYVTSDGALLRLDPK